MFKTEVPRECCALEKNRFRSHTEHRRCRKETQSCSIDDESAEKKISKNTLFFFSFVLYRRGEHCEVDRIEGVSVETPANGHNHEHEESSDRHEHGTHTRFWREEKERKDKINKTKEKKSSDFVLLHKSKQCNAKQKHSKRKAIIPSFQQKQNNNNAKIKHSFSRRYQARNRWRC